MWQQVRVRRAGAGRVLQLPDRRAAGDVQDPEDGGVGSADAGAETHAVPPGQVQEDQDRQPVRKTR